MRRRPRPFIISDTVQKKLTVMNRKPTKVPAAVSDKEITCIIWNIQTLISFDGAVKDA